MKKANNNLSIFKVLSMLFLTCGSILFSASNVNAMEVRNHVLVIPSSISKTQLNNIYRALYNNPNIFHFQLDEKSNRAIVISRPNVSDGLILDLLHSVGINPSSISSKVEEEDAFTVEKKALARNQVIDALKIK